MEKRNKRLAVLVGCNYPNTRNELHGCINDVHTMRHTLINRFGFDPSHIELLTDTQHAHHSVIKPTGANIKQALSRMIDQAEPGDVLFFHYSGHGTQIPLSVHGHRSKQEEAIVPCDFNLITDVDFRQLVNHVPKGATFTMLSDSCYSGGLIDKEKEQIGPHSSSNPTKQLFTTSHKLPKTIPFESVLQHLSSLTGINTPDIGTHLLESFGPDASLRFRQPDQLDSQSTPLKPDEGILLSGCQSNETSADVMPEEGGKAYGAFSNAVQMVLKENNGAMSNRKVAVLVRKVLDQQGFKQHPCLYSSDENADATFMLQQESYGA